MKRLHYEHINISISRDITHRVRSRVRRERFSVSRDRLTDGRLRENNEREIVCLFNSFFKYIYIFDEMSGGDASTSTSSRSSHEPIHSGHFMTSNYTDIQADEDEDVEVYVHRSRSI